MKGTKGPEGKGSGERGLGAWWLTGRARDKRETNNMILIRMGKEVRGLNTLCVEASRD